MCIAYRYFIKFTFASHGFIYFRATTCNIRHKMHSNKAKPTWAYSKINAFNRQIPSVSIQPRKWQFVKARGQRLAWMQLYLLHYPYQIFISFVYSPIFCTSIKNWHFHRKRNTIFDEQQASYSMNYLNISSNNINKGNRFWTGDRNRSKNIAIRWTTIFR